MILAAADYAEKKGPPPPELKAAFHAQAFRALPRAGGLEDQPAGLLSRMLQAWNTFTAVLTYRRMEAQDPDGREKWKTTNPELWEIIQNVRKLREDHARSKD